VTTGALRCFTVLGNPAILSRGVQLNAPTLETPCPRRERNFCIDSCRTIYDPLDVFLLGLLATTRHNCSPCCHSEPFAACHSEPFAACHSKPYAFCHSEPKAKNLAQGKLHEESRGAQGRLRRRISDVLWPPRGVHHVEPKL